MSSSIGQTSAIVPLEQAPVLPALVYQAVYPPDVPPFPPPAMPLYTVSLYRSVGLHQFDTNHELETLLIPIVTDGFAASGFVCEENPWAVQVLNNTSFIPSVRVKQFIPPNPLVPRDEPQVVTYWHRLFTRELNAPPVGVHGICSDEIKAREVHALLPNPGSSDNLIKFYWLKLPESLGAQRNFFFQQD